MLLKPTLRGAGALTVLCTIAISGRSAQGDVFYDNFGPGNSYSRGSGYAFGGPFSGAHFDTAMAFTAANPYLLTAGEFALSAAYDLGSPIPSSLTISIRADAAGLPGAVLEEVTITQQLGASGVFSPPVMVNFAGTTLLSAGAQYWIHMSADEPHRLIWKSNNTGDFGLRAFQIDGGPWTAGNGNEALGAFRLHGTLVPGPGVIALLGVCGCTPRRRRAQCCITETP